MPKGLVGNGDYRNGTPIHEPKDFGTKINWTPKPSEFGDPINEPKDFGNKVTWAPSPSHFGNQIGGSAATPTFDPPAGTYGVPQRVIITSVGNDAIFFTVDGSTPDVTSQFYDGSVFIPSSMTLKAIAYVNGVASSVGSAAYVISNP